VKTNTNTTKQQIVDKEYNRLINKYKSANVDENKLAINDSWIRKVAELFAVLEMIKDLPSIIYNPKNPIEQQETAAGKARVKYMAQYTSSMQKLNKDLLGSIVEQDDDLDDYE